MDVSEITVVVATYGALSWRDLAHERAIPSAEPQAPVVHVHGESLHGARNAALALVRTPWVIHVDADDELSADYCEQMATGTADLRVPAVAYVRGGQRRAPYIPRVAGHRHDCCAECLTDGNWIVVGACVRTQLVRDVGGWEPFSWSEDWALWARCWRAGATVEVIPSAVYVAHVNPRSRNRAPAQDARNRAHWEIHRAVWPEQYA